MKNKDRIDGPNSNKPYCYQHPETCSNPNCTQHN